MRDRIPIFLAAVALVALPVASNGFGLPLAPATELVIFAIACMGLNVLVGEVGLVSVGHGVFFGLGAYAAALVQRHGFTDGFVLPVLIGAVLVTGMAAAVGWLILRRRGPYFPILTFMLIPVLHSAALHWTPFT